MTDPTRCGLNADWIDDAWHVGPSSEANVNGGDFYVLDDSDYGVWLVVRRFYVDDDYAGISDEHRAIWADGANDAIPELGEFASFSEAVNFARSLMTDNERTD